MTHSLKQLRFLNTAVILRGEESVIGRSEYSSIIIPDASVSRLHATVSHRDGETSIQDLGSKNGTFVNGEPVHERPVPIDVGDEVRVGNVACYVESISEDARITVDANVEDTVDSKPNSA